MLELFTNSTLYIKLLLGIILLGCTVFSIVLFNRIRVMNKILSLPTGPLIEGIAILLFVLSLGLLLTTLVIL